MSRECKIRVLIISTSDHWRRSVSTYLASLPDVESFLEAEGGLTAYDRFCSELPHVVLMDDSMPQTEITMLLTSVKAVCNRVYCILMVATSRQTATALAAGADAVVLRSGSSRQLATAVLTAKGQIAAGG